jgi:hypothetical protein
MVPAADLRVDVKPSSFNIPDVYESQLFHGPRFHGLDQLHGCSEEGIVVTAKSAPAASTWMMEPARGQWLADPLVIDVALQAVILWSQQMRGKPCLPCAVTNYRQFRRSFPREGTRITVKVRPGADQLIRCEIEFMDAAGQLVARMEGCENVAEASLVNAFRRTTIE